MSASESNCDEPLGNFEENFRVHSPVLGGHLHTQAGPLEHLGTLIFALIEGNVDLVGVQKRGEGQAGQGQLCGRGDHARVTATGGPVGQRGCLLGGEVIFPGLCQYFDC